MLPTSRIHVPDPMEHTRAAHLLRASVLPAENLHDLAPVFGGGRYDFVGQKAVETTAVALAACCQACSLPAGSGGAGWQQELFEVPGALLLPDRSTQYGKRLFVIAELMDLSGSCQVRIAEEPAHTCRRADGG